MGRWRAEECGKIVDENGAFLGRANSDEDAKNLCSDHKADCDTYEVEIQKFKDAYVHDREIMADNVAQLVAYEARIADLTAELARVKAESLRVVGLGEACIMADISMFSLFTCDHAGVWLKFGLDSWHYYARNIMTGEETAMLDSARVQPVRLVPLEDVG